jgi:hypothetical protein
VQPGGKCSQEKMLKHKGKDFSRVSGRLDSLVLRAKIPTIPAMRAWVRVPESQKVRGILSRIPRESGI